MGLPLIRFGAERPDCFLQKCQLRFDHVPDDGEIDAGVFVDEDVPKAGDLRPVDLRPLGSQLGRQALHRLAEVGEVAADAILDEEILRELLERLGRRVELDPADRLQDVVEVEPLRTPRHRPPHRGGDGRRV
jgi:hypothetical protein